jgi:hypothetical protein
VENRLEIKLKHTTEYNSLGATQTKRPF